MSIYSVVDIIAFVLIAYCLLHKNKKWQNCVISIFLIAWTLLVSLRGYGVGNDTSGYAYFFSGNLYKSLNFVNYGTIDNPAGEIETGFVLISRLLSIISTSPTFLFSVIAIIFFSAIAQFYRNGHLGSMGLLWLFTSTYSMMNIIYVSRQCLSLGLFFWGIIIIERTLNSSEYAQMKIRSVFKNRRFLGGIALIILSVFVHRTSIIALIIVSILSYVKMSRVGAYFFVCISFITSLFYFSDLKYIFDYLFISLEGVSFQDFSVLTRYQDTLEAEHVSFLNLASFVLPCIVSIYYATESEINNKSFKMYIMSICLYNLFSSSTYMLRFIGVFFILGYPAAIPNAISKHKGLLLFYLSITLYYLLKMINIYANWPVHISSDLPYKFVWE